MLEFKTQFEALLKEKELPTQYQAIEGGHHLYRFQFRASKERTLMVEVILQKSEESYFDAQIIYRLVHVLDDYQKKFQALEAINDLNGAKTGYYNLYLAGDGEIYLRSLIRCGQDPRPLYDTLVIGSTIARLLQKSLPEKLGKSL